MILANNGFTLGILAPGQTFNGCMQANAGNYSLLGADFALNANGQIANNFWLGFTNNWQHSSGGKTQLLGICCSWSRCWIVPRRDRGEQLGTA